MATKRLCRPPSCKCLTVCDIEDPSAPMFELTEEETAVFVYDPDFPLAYIMVKYSPDNSISFRDDVLGLLKKIEAQMEDFLGGVKEVAEEATSKRKDLE